MPKKKKTSKKNTNQGDVILHSGNLLILGHLQMQETRKALMNDIRGLIRHKNEGIPFNIVELKKEKKKIKFDKKYADDNLPNILEDLKVKGKITDSEHDYLKKHLDRVNGIKRTEKSYSYDMNRFVKGYDIWHMFLSHIPGIGPIVATRLIVKFGLFEKFNKISSVWRYFGYHVVCPNCTKEVPDDRANDEKDDDDDKIYKKIVPVSLNKVGVCPICGSRGVYSQRKTGMQLDFADNMRSLGFNIGECLIRCKSPYYYNLYIEQKEIDMNRKYQPGELNKLYGRRYEKSATQIRDIHAHRRASRRMVKRFLAHLFIASKQISGQRIVSRPYVEAKMGHEHITTWQDILVMNHAPVPDIRHAS